MKRSGGVRGLIGLKDFVSMDIHNSGLLGNRNTASKEEVQKDHETAYKAKTLHEQCGVCEMYGKTVMQIVLECPD